MPADTNPHATVQFDDAVFGHQEFNLAHDVGDTIVRRADGLFSYQLVVVVDDLDMGVDDIVRGRDLLRSNALQIAIRRALIKAGFRKAKTQASAPSQHAPQSQYTPYNPETHGTRICRLSTTRPAAGSPNASVLWIWGRCARMASPRSRLSAIVRGCLVCRAIPRIPVRSR